jgi:hypothetical protein
LGDALYGRLVDVRGAVSSRPQAVLDAADSVRASLPNRWCDPRIAADLFEEVIDEYLLCDEMGLNVCATEHHAGINSLLGANPMLVSILARQTRKRAF